MNNLKIEAKKELVAEMKKSLRESNSFSYYSKNILKSMSAIEEITGEMFQTNNPEFEKKFWAAHDHKDMNAIKQLNAIINKAVDNLRG